MKTDARRYTFRFSLLLFPNPGREWGESCGVDANLASGVKCGKHGATPYSNSPLIWLPPNLFPVPISHKISLSFSRSFYPAQTSSASGGDDGDPCRGDVRCLRVLLLYPSVSPISIPHSVLQHCPPPRVGSKDSFLPWCVLSEDSTPLLCPILLSLPLFLSCTNLLRFGWG